MCDAQIKVRHQSLIFLLGCLTFLRLTKTNTGIYNINIKYNKLVDER